MKNESLSVCNTTLSALYYDLQSSPLWLDFFCIALLPFFFVFFRNLQNMILVGRDSANLSYPAYPAYDTHRIA